jgi:biopolymer transport protein ExbB
LTPGGTRPYRLVGWTRESRRNRSAHRVAGEASVWEFIERGGVWVMIPLLACSVVSAGFVIDRVVFWVKYARGRNRALVEQFLQLADEGLFAEAADRARGSRDPVVGVLHCGLVHRNYDLKSALEMAGAAQLERMERFLPVLDTIITLSPLLGILGTVVGIIDAFGLLSASVAVGDPQAVTGGIAQALITTATGLVIAISTLIPYNYFRARADRVRHYMEDGASRLEIVLQKRGHRDEPPPTDTGRPVPHEANMA